MIAGKGALDKCGGDAGCEALIGKCFQANSTHRSYCSTTPENVEKAEGLTFLEKSQLANILARPDPADAPAPLAPTPAPKGEGETALDEGGGGSVAPYGKCSGNEDCNDDYKECVKENSKGVCEDVAQIDEAKGISDAQKTRLRRVINGTSAATVYGSGGGGGDSGVQFYGRVAMGFPVLFGNSLSSDGSLNVQPSTVQSAQTSASGAEGYTPPAGGFTEGVGQDPTTGGVAGESNMSNVDKIIDLEAGVYIPMGSNFELKTGLKCEIIDVENPGEAGQANVSNPSNIMSIRLSVAPKIVLPAGEKIRFSFGPLVEVGPTLLLGDGNGQVKFPQGSYEGDPETEGETGFNHWEFPLGFDVSATYALTDSFEVGPAFTVVWPTNQTEVDPINSDSDMPVEDTHIGVGPRWAVGLEFRVGKRGKK